MANREKQRDNLMKRIRMLEEDLKQSKDADNASKIIKRIDDLKIQLINIYR